MTISRRKFSTLHQPSLFDPPPQTPSWNAHAPDVRAAVTQLVARMLREHWERQDEHIPREADHE